VCGFFLGLSIFAPGFSGSLVAIAMGIYHEFVRIMANPFKKFKQNMLFCSSVGIGIAFSAVLFVLTFRQLFDSHEKAIYLLFIGLIAGSIPIVLLELKKIGFKSHYLVGAISAFLLAVLIGVFASGTGLMSGDTATISDWPGLALGGFAAGVTALIPGMSLATILIILGVYSPLIYAADALLRMDMSFLIPIGLFLVCTVIGLVSTAKGIKYVFERFPGFANTTVLGFQFGSLVSIIYQSRFISDENFTWILGVIMVIAGLCISGMFILMGRFMNREESGTEQTKKSELMKEPDLTNESDESDESDGLND